MFQGPKYGMPGHMLKKVCHRYDNYTSAVSYFILILVLSQGWNQNSVLLKLMKVSYQWKQEQISAGEFSWHTTQRIGYQDSAVRKKTFHRSMVPSHTELTTQLQAQLRKPVSSLTTTHIQDYTHTHLYRHTNIEIFKYSKYMNVYIYYLGMFVFQFPVFVTCREAVILNTF